MNFNTLADFFAGQPDDRMSPAIRGMAESDSSDGEVDIYVGEMEQVYETESQPVYETDDEGNLVYDENDDPIPLVDDQGNVIYEEQTVYDEDGNPVPVLDEDGNPVFEKVQLVDCDGEPIVEYDADGNPIAQTDEHGDPIYIEDEQGNPLPVLDENDEPVYTYDENGDEVPLYQVLPVEESQVVTIGTVGAVKAGETPVVTMGFGGAAAIASNGWGDRVEVAIDNAATIAEEAAEVAEATNQHFFSDTQGIHVTENESDATTGHNILINSLGILLRSAVSNLVSITRSAIAFFDGQGNADANVVARFGRDGAVVGREAEQHIELTDDGMLVHTAERGTGTSAEVGVAASADGARLGMADGWTVGAGASGVSIASGADKVLEVTGDLTGWMAVAKMRAHGELALDGSGSIVQDAIEGTAVLDDARVYANPGDTPSAWIRVDVPPDGIPPVLQYYDESVVERWDETVDPPVPLDDPWVTVEAAGPVLYGAVSYLGHMPGIGLVEDGYLFELASTSRETAHSPLVWRIAQVYPERRTAATFAVKPDVGGVPVSLEGHTHTAAEVGALPDTTHIPPDMVVLSYGKSTWADFIAAYSTNSVVYCRASSNSNPASGSQTRMAFLAYVSNADNPTNVEFQYYRSVSSHSQNQQGDQVYIYKLTSSNAWSVTVREASVKVAAGDGLELAYASGTATLSAKAGEHLSIGADGAIHVETLTAQQVANLLTDD